MVMLCSLTMSCCGYIDMFYEVLNLAWIDSALYSPSLHPSTLPKGTVCMSTMMIDGAGFSTDGNKGITMKQQGHFTLIQQTT